MATDITQKRLLFRRHMDNKPVELDFPEDFEKLTPDEQKTLVDWCTSVYRNAKTEWDTRTSYGLKHDFEDHWPEGFYVTNGQFKGAMLKAGFRPCDTSGKNWTFYVRPRDQRDYKEHLHHVQPGAFKCLNR